VDREQALDLALGQIERQYGKGSVMRMSDQAQAAVGAVSTGSLSLDLALGVGGLPRGRIIEIFGPESSGKTTLVYHVIAEAQRRGGICAFVDAEHAMDPQYARRIGVNIEDLLVSQPDHGEQALEIAELLVRSGALDVVAVDSVAALTPKAEIEGEMGDSHVGLQARLMSQALRKLAGTLNKTDTICIFTNQLREKIGVMFGCLSANTSVVLADGTTERIATIVNQRLPVEVLSMDPETGEISSKRVVDWFRNGETQDWVRFEVAGGQGRHRLTCTPGHLIFTPQGERAASDIAEGDEVLVATRHYALSEDQEQMIIGGALGDGVLRRHSGRGVAFRVGHGDAQREYLDWKHEMLAPFAQGIGRTGRNGHGFDTLPMHQLGWLHDAVYPKSGAKCAVNTELVERLDARGIAVWYADDGTFSGHYDRWGHGKAEICAKSLDRSACELLARRCEELGMGRPTVTSQGRLLFSGDRTQKLHERIAEYVHPSMQYKIHPELRGRFRWHPDTSDAHLNGTRLKSRTSVRPTPMRVMRKYRTPASPDKRVRYDLEIEDNHTYLASHVVVHNSPETTPGGRALKFYSSVRLDIRRIETLKDGMEAVGNRVRVKVAKNKVAPPFKQAEFDIIYGSGISWEGTVLDAGLERKIVQKSGSYFSFDDERLGQGRQNATAFLREHPDVTERILARIQAELGPDLVASARLLPSAREAEQPAVEEVAAEK
jgi:recombination protein RecA